MGFGDRALSQPLQLVFYDYLKCVEEFDRREKRSSELQYVYFSDSFLIYAPDNSARSFAMIDSVSRSFVNLLIRSKIPLRGSMACGEFYADKIKNIFVGKALVEASREEKHYNWIGFVLCPSAVLMMAQIGLPANERGLNYVEWPAPIKEPATIVKKEKTVFAYVIGASSLINGHNIYISQLEEMSRGASKQEIKEKYANTIRFLNAFRRA